MKFSGSVHTIQEVDYKPKKNRIGEVYGELTIIGYAGKVLSKSGKIGDWVVECRCSCGDIEYHNQTYLINRSTDYPCRRVLMERSKSDKFRTKEQIVEDTAMRKQEAIDKKIKDAENKVANKEAKDLRKVELILERQTAKEIKQREKEEKKQLKLQEKRERKERNAIRDKRRRIRELSLTYDRLRELLEYNPDTGIFTRKTTIGTFLAGSIAGHTNKRSGYVFICVDNKTYRAHILAWFYSCGEFPKLCIDHINRIKNDNRIENLREVSHTCNMRNQKLTYCNTSGVTGVRLYKDNVTWLANIGVNGKVINLGRYDLFESAVMARWEAEKFYKFTDHNTVSTAENYLKENNLI